MHLKSDDKHFEMRVQKTKKLLSEGSNEYLSQYPCTCDFFFFVVLDYLSLIKFGIKKINGQGGGASKGLPKVDHLCHKDQMNVVSQQLVQDILEYVKLWVMMSVL